MCKIWKLSGYGCPKMQKNLLSAWVHMGWYARSLGSHTPSGYERVKKSDTFTFRETDQHMTQILCRNKKKTLSKSMSWTALESPWWDWALPCFTSCHELLFMPRPSTSSIKHLYSKVLNSISASRLIFFCLSFLNERGDIFQICFQSGH